MILNTNHNYKDSNFKLNPDVAHNNSINFRTQQYIQNYLNYNHNKNNNFLNQANLFNINNFAMNNYMTQYAQQMKSKNINNIISPINTYNNNNSFSAQIVPKNYHHFNEKLLISCICDNSNFCPKNELKQCILCRKYQHKSCINQAKEINPYICFNCQFENNHFYLRWKKAILPAKEFIYKKKWEEDPSFLKEGTKNFEFELNLQELYDEFNIKPNNNNDENISYYLAILCLTNNGRPFHLGFPDNINIAINDKKFYNTESKGFKRPLLLALENNKYYIKKTRHLITHDKYEIPNAADFFINKNNNNNYTQKLTISFSNNLENYRGSEFEFVDVRHYLIYIGVFQEIKIPQMSLLRECKNLEEYSNIFKNFYEEKVKKIKWNKIANFISMDNEELNMNMISEISNQKIICPVRGLFCQHSEVMDFGECCGYITSNNQVYKCFKCNKPLNIMYIDEMSEKIFNRYKNENYSQIYFTNKFKFIRGEKLEENAGKNSKNNVKQIDVDPSDESLSESFFKFYENKVNNDEALLNDNNEVNKTIANEIIEINSDSESMMIEPNNDNNNNNYNNIYLGNPLIDNNNMDLEQNNKKVNETSKTISDNVNNLNNNSNENSRFQDNIVVINNLDKSDDDIQPSDNTESNVINNKIYNNDENKNEEVINLMEEDDDINEESKDNVNFNLINSNNNKIFDKEKENITDNSATFQQNQGNKSSRNISNSNNNNNSESFTNTRKNDINNFLENVQEVIKEKNTSNLLNSDSSKDSKDNNNSSNQDKEQELLEKKRKKVIHKRKKKNEVSKEKDSIEENDFHSPRKRRFRRIEDGLSNNAKNKKNIKEKEIIKEKKNGKGKGKENNNKNNINKINNIIDKNSNSKSDESINKERDNYLNISIYKDKDIINSSESNSHNSKNRLSKNKLEIKNKRRNSDITSSSNSYNTLTNNNVTNSEYENKELNNNRAKRNKKLRKNNVNKEKEKLNNNDSENDEFIQMNNDIQNNNNNNDDKILEENDFETIMIDSKDLIEARPFNDKKENGKIMNIEEEEFLNDFEIFENELLDNNQMEFVNYDYYNIQRKLREYCSLRYQDDEIFQKNRPFFNKFK